MRRIKIAVWGALILGVASFLTRAYKAVAHRMRKKVGSFLGKSRPMTFKEQLQQAADAGKQQRDKDEQKAAEQRAAAELQRTLAEQANLAAAREALKALPERVQAAVRKSEALCTAHIIPAGDINFPREYCDGEPLEASTLKGVSHHIFALLEEEKLEPRVVVPCKGGLYLIKIAVPQASA